MSQPPAPRLGLASQAELRRSLQQVHTVATLGRVVQAGGTLLRATGVRARVGQSCRVFDPQQPHERGLLAEVIGFQAHEAVLAPLGPLRGVPVGAAVEVLAEVAQLPGGSGLLGRVIDAFGQPLDDGPPLDGLPRVPLYRDAPPPLQRRPVAQPLVCGVRAIDALLTVGEGQRLGIFAMAGGGKSTLLGMLARSTRAEVNVIGLIGERGREVREFIDDSLGAEGLARSVVVVSTSDRPALERVRAAHAATAIAEGLRAEGRRVLLMMDSVTRFARGLRELGLAAHEPAVRRGYPPSVFAELPRLFERAGNDAHGSITAFYTVLAEDEEGSDPVAEEVRSILDGHLVLSRALAQAQHYPAIDVLASASRVFNRVTGAQQQRDAAQLRALMARHKEVEFLLRVGEYQAGSDPLADQAIERLPQIRALLQQGTHEPAGWDSCLQHLREIVA
ncbi:FliI/YscN family ATPase [Aquabacterium sp. OR-4]|uniref:FliI/YscN family ATPase n=1 Tax=Aquabacterium sp. OR-4 TaxID=2978127 RepID=UPI0021B4B851|nr:FliI/YscN family ATPase [Aquabacterium sp. OR-4]MDT7837968.1 FliI/YscN family ATPase [Aquabacterium sp. OR-4]